MDDGLQTTLDLLAETENEAAIRVLIPALDSRFRAIRHGAFQAILAPQPGRPPRSGRAVAHDRSPGAVLP